MLYRVYSLRACTNKNIPTEVRHKGSDVPTEVRHKSSDVPTEVRHKDSDVPTEVRHKGSDVPTEVRHKGSNVSRYKFSYKMRHKGSDVANHAPLFLTHIQHHSLPPYYMYYNREHFCWQQFDPHAHPHLLKMLIPFCLDDEARATWLFWFCLWLF